MLLLARYLLQTLTQHICKELEWSLLCFEMCIFLYYIQIALLKRSCTYKHTSKQKGFFSLEIQKNVLGKYIFKIQYLHSVNISPYVYIRNL